MRPISRTALSKKGPIGYKHSLPNADSPNKVVTVSGDSTVSPQRGSGPPEDSPDWARSCHPHSGTAVRHPAGGVREHSLPTILGLLALGSPCRVPSPWMGNEGYLGG